MNGIKEFWLLIGSMGIITALLTVFFDWRARLLSHIRGERIGGFRE